MAGGRAASSFPLLRPHINAYGCDPALPSYSTIEIVEKCPARRQVFRDRTHLASRSRAQNIHDPLSSLFRAPRHGPACSAGVLGGRIHGRHNAHSSSVSHLECQFACGRNVPRSSPSHRGGPSESVHHFESQNKRFKDSKCFGRT